MYNLVVKRFFDFLIALILLPFLLIVMFFVAIAIKIDDHGPVFYCAKRIGRKGKLFKMVKFRSMKVNAPDIRLADGSTYNGADDPRVTKVGGFLRRTSIDELPQILNVLVGHMSFIGPRPDPEDWLERYAEDEKIFLRVRPGITGYNQAYFRNGADGKQKIINDVYYAKNCTLWMDIKVVFKTIAMVLKREKTFKDTSDEVEAIDAVNVLRNQEKESA